jgi:hypothetical protein
MQAKKPSFGGWAIRFKPGGFLVSHTLARAVQSGLRGLTSVFGMGTGGTLSLWSPRLADGGGGLRLRLRHRTCRCLNSRIFDGITYHLYCYLVLKVR